MSKQRRSHIPSPAFIAFLLTLFILAIVLNVSNIQGLDEHTTPPQIITASPSGTITSNTLNLTIQTDENATCKYDASDTNYTSMTNLFTGSETEHAAQLNLLPDGPYTYYARCSDDYGNSMDSSVKISFVVDTISPTATNHSPNGKITSESTTLTITTDENATCRYSTTDNIDYENKLGTFDTTGNTPHPKNRLNDYFFFPLTEDFLFPLAEDSLPSKLTTS